MSNINNNINFKDIEKFISEFLNSEPGYLTHKEDYNDPQMMSGWSEYYYDQLLNISRAGLFEFVKKDFSNFSEIYDKSLDIEHYHGERKLHEAIDNQLNSNGSVVNKTIKATGTSTSHLKLSELIERYLKVDCGDIKVSTFNENKKILYVYLDYQEDIYISNIKQHHISEFRNQLKHYPSNRNKKADFKDLSFKETIEKAISLDTPKLSNGSVKKYLTRVVALLKWAFSDGYMEKLVGQNLTLGIKTKSTSRKPYTSEEVVTLFDYDNYYSSVSSQLCRYWIPLIGLYTGARIDEIATLTINDIIIVSDVYCLSINDTGEKSVKTSNSIRTIPIHPDLQTIGLIEYWNEVKKIKENSLLFPDIKINSNSQKLSRKISKWWSGYLVKLKIKSPEKVFHSFRNTMASNLRKNEVPDADIKDIIGHSQNDITYSTYAPDQDIKVLSKHINNVLHLIDLNNLEKIWRKILPIALRKIKQSKKSK